MLVTTALTLLTIILTLAAALHIYWTFGGTWALKDAMPVFEGEKRPMPEHLPKSMIIPTLLVATLLLAAAALFLWHAGLIDIALPSWIRTAGVWIATSVFLLRAIGEFRYVGFFKKVKDSGFARKDTKFYSPLCLFMAILALVIILG